LPLGIPGGVFGVTPNASKVATTGSNKDRGNSRKFPFALYAIKYFRDVHKNFGGKKLPILCCL
jgi:hypothetical protein